VVFKRILVPVDFTAGSDRALRYAAALARAHHARVLPLHVTPPICFTMDCGYGPVNRQVPDEDSLRQTRARLQRLVHRIVPAELAEDVTVRSGEPIEQIMMAATEWKADLIIMLAHDVIGGDSAPLTHTVDRLVREVRCPVLLLHPPTPSRKVQSLIQLGTP
jgi:nucleotide-binding universal stress UspA family protein